MTRPIQRYEHRSDRGHWVLFRQAPPVHLAPYVIEMEGYAESGGIPLLRRELPFIGVPLILVFENGFSLHDADDPGAVRPLTRSFIAGLTDRSTLVGSPGAAFCMQVNFTPLGARKFLRLDLDEIAGQIVDADDLLAKSMRGLDTRLAEQSDWPERFAMLEAALTEQIGDDHADAGLFPQAWAALNDSDGAMAIEALAQRFDCSRKHLRTLFRRELGLSPKAAARVLRFQRALHRLKNGPTSLADLALECGYFDQAHFNRDFKAFAGENPLLLAQRILPDGTGILAR